VCAANILPEELDMTGNIALKFTDGFKDPSMHWTSSSVKMCGAWYGAVMRTAIDLAGGEIHVCRNLATMRGGPLMVRLLCPNALIYGTEALGIS
jgi:hypothetical protein